MTSRFSLSQSEMDHGAKQYDKEQVKMVNEFTYYQCELVV